MVTYSCWLKSKKVQKKTLAKKELGCETQNKRQRRTKVCLWKTWFSLSSEEKKSCPHTLKKKLFEERPGRVFLINSPLILLKKGNFFAKPASHHSISALNLEKCEFIFRSMITSNAKINHFSFTLFAPSSDTSIWRNLSKRRFLKSCEAY